MLQFENNNTMPEYTLDGYKQTINGKQILTPQTLSYQNNKIHRIYKRQYYFRQIL